MNPNRLVMLSYYFPPLVGIASERASSRAESMTDLGWDVRVITVRDGHYHTVSELSTFEFPVIRTRSVEFSRIARRLYTAALRGRTVADVDATDGTIKPLSTGSRGARVRRWVREWTYIPDAQVGWIPFALLGAVRAAFPARKHALILSTSVPYSAHLAAWAAAGLSRAPWVAEFRDPWTTAHESRLPESRLRRQLDRAMERAIITRADHVVVTSETTRAGLLAAHPSLSPSRVTVVMNGFIPTADPPRPDSGERCEIVYAGTVDPGERPDVVLAALERLEARHPGRFLLRIVGPSGPWLKESQGRPDWLQCDGIVTPSAARDAMLAGSVLLLLQGHPAYTQILRGKAFEYIGARRPIVAVVPPECEMAGILRDHADVRIVPSYDVEELSNEFERLVEEHERGELAGARVPEEMTQSLTREAQARILDGILKDVLASG